MVAVNRFEDFNDRPVSWANNQSSSDEEIRDFRASQLSEFTADPYQDAKTATDILRLKFDIATLEKSLKSVREQIGSQSVIAKITEIPGFRLLNDISVTIQCLGEDECVATFFDANINASGETQAEAFVNLKHMIASSYRLFKKRADKLGDGPKEQFAALQRFIEE